MKTLRGGLVSVLLQILVICGFWPFFLGDFFIHNLLIILVFPIIMHLKDAEQDLARVLYLPPVRVSLLCVLN